MITLKTINKFLEDFSRQHYQINSYFFGDISKNRQVDVQYPFLIANPSNVTTGINQSTYTVYIWVLDRFQNGFVNESDIYNDTALILNDLKAYFQNNTVIQLILEDEVVFEKISDEINSDLVGGWVGIFKFSVPFSDDLCTIPMEGNGIAYSDDWRVISVGAGSSGTSGISGLRGSSGTSGLSGINGSNGTSGISGTSGTSGINGQNGLSSSLFYYQAKTNSQSGDPGSGHLLWNTVTQSAATQININTLTDLNVTDIDIFLQLLAVNQILYIQDRNNSNNYQRWRINGTPTKVGTTYWTVPVVLVGVNGLSQFNNNHDLILAIVNPSGTSGISGTSGTSGISGLSGTNGRDGIVGDGILINDFNYSYITNVGKTKVLCDGKILVIGTYDDGNDNFPCFFRLNPDYTLDTSFQPNFAETPFDFDVLSNGIIIVVGAFGDYNGNGINNIVALDQNGNDFTDLTNTFPSLNSDAYIVKIHPDGDIIVGGDFTGKLIKIDWQGLTGENIDFTTNLTTGGGFNGAVQALDFFKDGRIVVGGDFTTLDGVDCKRICILNPNGTTNQLASGNGFDEQVKTIKVLDNQLDILVGGYFSYYNSNTAKSFVRLFNNLTFNGAFISIGNLGEYVSDIKVQCDNKILIAGNFSFVNGINDYRKLIRLNSNYTIDEFFTSNFNLNFQENGGLTNTSVIFSINVDITNQIIASGVINTNNEGLYSKILLLYNYSQIACCNPCGECEIDGQSPYFKVKSKFDIDGYPAIHTQNITFNPTLLNINCSNPDIIKIVPFPVDRDCVIEKFYQVIENDCAANNHVTFGLYSEDGKGYPNKLLYNLGEYTINATNIDYIEIPFNKFLKKGLYYFCFMTQNNCDEVFFRATTMQHVFPYFADILVDGGIYCVAYLERNRTYFSGLPQYLDGYTPVFGLEQPLIMYSIKELR